MIDFDVNNFRRLVSGAFGTLPGGLSGASIPDNDGIGWIVYFSDRRNDVDNDGQWDAGRGGTDRDLDNDMLWDEDRGGTDRDIDNDQQWDRERGGTDRDLDNDGAWDFESDREDGSVDFDEE